MSKPIFVAGLVGGLIGAAVVGGGLIYTDRVGGPEQVRSALLDNPQMLIEANQELRRQQIAPVIDANRAAIETPFASSMDGAAQPAVTLVEFYDYACGYCRQAKPDIDRLIQENDDLRVVYRELPVLGEDSVRAARASLAASQAGRFSQFHERLYALGQPNDANVDAALAAVGLDPAAIDNPAFEAELQKNFELANALGASGTPLFVIGDRIINSADGFDAYQAAVDAAREANAG